MVSLGGGDENVHGKGVGALGSAEGGLEVGGLLRADGYGDACGGVMGERERWGFYEDDVCEGVVNVLYM